VILNSNMLFRILQIFAEHGLAKPKFEKIGTGFRVTIYQQAERIDVATIIPQVTPENVWN
jgi:hypothetical protein